MDKQGSLDFQWKIIIFVNDHFQKLEKGKKVKKRRKTKIKNHHTIYLPRNISRQVEL